MIMQKLLLAPLAIIAISSVSSTSLNAHENAKYSKDLGIKIETLVQSTKQWDGNFLPDYPTSNAEITVLRITIPAGVTLPLHTPPVISAGVILQGTLQLTLQDGTTRLFNQGAALIETVNTVHTGKSLGPKDTVVLVFYAGSKHLPRTVQVKMKAL